PHELGVEIHAGHVGHYEIAQHDVEGFAGADPFDRIERARGDSNVVLAGQGSSYRAQDPRLVIDDEDASPADRAAHGGLSHMGFDRTGGSAWQGHSKGAPFSDDAFDRDVASQGCDDPVADRQAKTRAHTRWLGRKKRREEPALYLGMHA